MKFRALSTAACAIGFALISAPAANADNVWGPDYDCSQNFGTVFSGARNWVISPYGSANMWCTPGFHGSWTVAYQLDPAGNRHNVTALFYVGPGSQWVYTGLPGLYQTN